MGCPSRAHSPFHLARYISIFAHPLVPNPYDAGDYLSLEELGQLAKRRRREDGETQEDAAAALRVEQSNISRAESGRSNAKDVLFRLIRHYTELDVESEPRYRLVEK
ncbi:helix-turn-helix domain-containing protein [Salinibacter ruber]|uniref:helix-turn-helix domain-containing protein n=1 Tax=Salinibacter ruber TaxID=146919 RepID=UPI003C6DB97C